MRRCVAIQRALAPSLTLLAGPAPSLQILAEHRAKGEEDQALEADIARKAAKAKRKAAKAAPAAKSAAAARPARKGGESAQTVSTRMARE